VAGGLTWSAVSVSRFQVLALFLLACAGPQEREASAPRAVPAMRLGEAQALYEIHSRVAGEDGRGVAELAVRRVERDELVGQLTLRAGMDREAGLFAGLGGITYHFRLAADGKVLAAGGCSGSSALPLRTLARALDLWPLILAALPRLPDSSSMEGNVWDAEQKSVVVGGGKELAAEVGGKWKLARLLAESPATAVLEGTLVVSVRDLAADAPPQLLTLSASVYLNIDRGGVDFVSVSGPGVSWSARRLSP
jgi:hypothetical protein